MCIRGAEESTGISWWNVNPIYVSCLLNRVRHGTEVLKQRLSPNFPNFEVHDARVPCWPSWSDLGFFEKGKDRDKSLMNARRHTEQIK